jgi:hypothetical protein
MIATILWRSIVSAIIPLSLREIIRKLPEIAARLVTLVGNPKYQVDKYREKHQSKKRCSPIENCYIAAQ